MCLFLARFETRKSVPIKSARSTNASLEFPTFLFLFLSLLRELRTDKKIN